MEGNTIIEVNGVKLEADLRTARRIDTLRVRDRVRVLFDRQIEQKRRELEDLEAKKAFFLNEFRKYWEFERVEAPGRDRLTAHRTNSNGDHMAKTTKARPLEDDVSDPVTMAYFQYAHLAAGLRVAQRAVGEAEDHLMRIAQDQSGITYPRVTYDPELRKVVVTNDRPQKAIE